VPHPAVRCGVRGVNALIFDCDGVLSDTERDGHLPAFNQTFAEFGLPVTWSVADYAEKLRIGGGKERMASLLTESFVRAARLPPDAEGQQREVARWHRRKTELYRERVLAGQLPPRPGVRRLIEEALAAGWQLAVASTSAEESVRAVLEVAAGRANAERFSAVLAGDVVARKKPAPDIYALALDTLGVRRDQAVVIEDSRNGLDAAHALGLATIITVNGYTEHEDFSAAALVLDHLGDPGQPLRVLADPLRVRPVRELKISDLSACLARLERGRRGPTEASGSTSR
jgi:HAD superfamily hydrolase (TIGR01509 family)